MWLPQIPMGEFKGLSDFGPQGHKLLILDLSTRERLLDEEGSHSSRDQVTGARDTMRIKG